MIAVIMGVGDWSDQDGEYYRHPFGNALIEKAYADYEYKNSYPRVSRRLMDRSISCLKISTLLLKREPSLKSRLKTMFSRLKMA